MYRNYPRLTFDQINIFLTAAKFENFSKAAQALNITQPSVSKNIVDMEDILGVILFVRHQKQVHLTNAGRLLVKEFEQLLNQAAEIMEKAYQVQSNQFNKLKICSVNILRNNHYLRPVIQKFQSQNPQVEITFEIMDPFKQMEMLIQGSYDIGIVSSAFGEYLKKNGLAVHLIREDFPDLMLSARHPLYENAQENISAVLKSPIAVISDENQLFPQWVNSVLQELQQPHGELTFVSNLDTAAALVELGTHVFICSRLIHFNSAEPIKAIPLESVSKSAGLIVAYQPDFENIFIRKFISEMGKMGWPE